MLFRSILSLSFIALVIFMPAHLSAAINVTKNMRDLDKICSKSPADCLPEINQKLKSTPVQSRVWYDLMQYKFEALFALQHIKALHEASKPWINTKDLPIPFQTSLFIYYAKSLEEDKTLNVETIKQQRKKFMRKAQKLLGLMNEVYPNPTLLMQFGNLQMIVGEYEQAYKFLQSLVIKYRRYPDLAYNLDLYANLGHLADRLGYKEQAIQHWLTSLYWAKQLGNDQQTATVFYNLARSQTTNKNYINAKFNAEKAIEYATLARDYVKQAQAQLLTVQLLLNLKQKAAAKEMLNSIKVEILSSEMLKEFTRLKNQV